MKKNNKELINKVEYLENEEAIKILKSVKNSDRIFYIIYFLLTISYILLMIHVISTMGLILITVLYLILSLDLALTQKRYTDRVMKETIEKTILPEAYINLNIYNAKKILCNERMYKYSLNNIAYGYILLGDFEEAKKFIKYVDSKRKDLILQSQIIQNKMEILFLQENIKECNKECANLEKIIKFIPGKYKKEARLNINLKRAINEKNFQKTDELCNELEKKKKIFYKVKAAYYRGLVQERRKENCDEYYKFVAENGNNIIIANNARKKLKITDIKNIYNKSNHIAYKIFKFIALLLVIYSTIFWSMYTIYIFNK